MTVELAELEARIAEFGPRAFLVTVGTDPRAHVVSASVSYVDGRLVVGAGRRTRANLEQNPAVVLLWPGAPDARLSLIVDGIVDDVHDQLAEPDNDLSVQPARGGVAPDRSALTHVRAALPGCARMRPARNRTRITRCTIS